MKLSKTIKKINKYKMLFLFIVGIIMCLAMGGFFLYKKSTNPNTKQTSEQLAVKQPINSSKNNTNYTTVARDTANAKKLDDLNNELQEKLNKLNTILYDLNIKFEPSDFPDKLERKQHIIDNFEIIKQLILLILSNKSTNLTKKYLINKMQMSEVRINQEIEIRKIINNINTENIIDTHLIDELLKLLKNEDKNTIIKNYNDHNNYEKNIGTIIENDKDNIHKNPKLLKKILLMDAVRLGKLKNVQDMVKKIKEPQEKDKPKLEFDSDFIYDLDENEMKTILNINDEMEIQHIYDSIALKQSVVGRFSRINFKEIMMQKNVDGINQEIEIRKIINNIIDTHLIDELLKLLKNEDKNTIIKNYNDHNNYEKNIGTIIENDKDNIHKNPKLLKKILLMDAVRLGKLKNVQDMVKKIKKPQEKDKPKLEFDSDFIYDLDENEMETILNINNIKKIRTTIIREGKSKLKKILMSEGEKQRRKKKRKEEKGEKEEKRRELLNQKEIRELLNKQINAQINAIQKTSITNEVFSQNTKSTLNKIFEEFGFVGLYLYLVINKGVVDVKNIEKLIEILEKKQHLFYDRDIQSGVEYVNNDTEIQKQIKSNFKHNTQLINDAFKGIGINEIEWDRDNFRIIKIPNTGRTSRLSVQHNQVVRIPNSSSLPTIDDIFKNLGITQKLNLNLNENDKATIIKYYSYNIHEPHNYNWKKWADFVKELINIKPITVHRLKQILLMNIYEITKEIAIVNLIKKFDRNFDKKIDINKFISELKDEQKNEIIKTFTSGKNHQGTFNFNWTVIEERISKIENSKDKDIDIENILLSYDRSTSGSTTTPALTKGIQDKINEFTDETKKKISNIKEKYGLVGLYMYLNLEYVKEKEKRTKQAEQAEQVKQDLLKKEQINENDIQKGVNYVNNKIQKKYFQTNKEKIIKLFENIGINIEWDMKNKLFKKQQQIIDFKRKHPPQKTEAPPQKIPRGRR